VTQPHCGKEQAESGSEQGFDEYLQPAQRSTKWLGTSVAVEIHTLLVCRYS
jgi:hypothetical protein